MDNYTLIKEHLILLRAELLDAAHSDAETQDLTDQFYKVRDNNPATYELLILMQDEFQTISKFNKTQFISMLNKSLDIKSLTIDKMIIERSKYFTWDQKIWSIMTWQNAKRLLSVALISISFLFTLHLINPDGLDATFSSVKELLIKQMEIK